MEISKHDLRRIFADSIDYHLSKFCEKNGIKTKDIISQRQAVKLFGKDRLQRLIDLKKVHPSRIGSGKNATIRYSRSEIELQLTIESIL